MLALASTLSCTPSDTDTPDQAKSDSGGGETAEDGGDSATPVLDAALSVDASASSDAALPDAAALSDDTATQHTELSDAGDSDAAMQPVPPLVVPGNSLSNPSFEDPITGWRGMGNASVASTDERAHTGVRSLVASGRTEIWTGPALEIRELVVPGASYHLRAWVSTADDHQAIGASMMAVCATGDAGEADAGEQELYTPVAREKLSSVSNFRQ